jgi:hypothetical protein
MGSKKNAPEEIFDDESESEEKRVEGADADLFSHPLEYIPRFPAPPKYIKVRSRGKKAKDFDHVFLAQELRERTGAEIAQAGGRRLARSAGMTPAEKAKQKNPVWKLEFSKDGKFLAAGGHDSIVRVWAVIATPGDRLAHEREEDEATKDHSRTRLSAPVFGTKPIQEYQGHTASVLDLSWSKVSARCPSRTAAATADLVEQLSPLQLHGPDRQAVAQQPGRMSLLLQARRYRDLHTVPSSRRSLFPRRLSRFQAAVVEHPGQIRGALEPLQRHHHGRVVYARRENRHCRLFVGTVYVL